MLPPMNIHELLAVANWAAQNKAGHILQSTLNCLSQEDINADVSLMDRLNFYTHFHEIARLRYTEEFTEQHFVDTLNSFDELILNYHKEALEKGCKHIDFCQIRKRLLTMVVVSNLSSIFDLQEIYLMEDYNLIDVKGFNLMQYKKKTLPALFENIRTQHDIDGIPPASVQAYERMVDLNEKTVTDLFQIPATHAKQALYDLFSSTSLPRYADAILAFLIDLEQRLVPRIKLTMHIAGPVGQVPHEQEWTAEQGAAQRESLLSSPKPETSETKASSALKEKSSSSGQGPTHAAGSGHSSVLAAQSKAVRERLEEATGEFNRSNAGKDPMLAILESQPKVVLALKAGDSGKKGGRSLRSQTKVVQEEDYPAVPLDEGDDTATHSQVEEVEELTRVPASSGKKVKKVGSKAAATTSKSLMDTRASAISLQFDTQGSPAPNTIALGSESANKRLRVAEAIENSSASSLGEEGSEPGITAGLAIRLKRAAVRKQIRKSHFGSPMGSNNRRGSKGKSRGRGLRKEWTYQEEEALVEGVKRHGDGHWKSILEDPDLGPLLHLRSNVDLKDKARNLRNRNLL